MNRAFYFATLWNCVENTHKKKKAFLDVQKYGWVVTEYSEMYGRHIHMPTKMILAGCIMVLTMPAHYIVQVMSPLLCVH